MKTPTKRQTVIRILIDNLKVYLEARHYSAETIRLHCAPTWNRIADYAEVNGYHSAEREWVFDFLAGYWESIGVKGNFNICRKHCRAAEMLCEYQKSGQVIRLTGWKREVQNAEKYRPLYDAVEAYSSHNKLQVETKKAHLNEINKLVVFLEKRSIELDSIDSTLMKEYLFTLGHHAQTTIAYCHFILRNVMKIAYKTGSLATDLSDIFERIHLRQGRNIPSAYKPEEIEALLGVVDRANDIGKRDYAILLIAARLGLRVSDIRTLTFDNIDWVSNQIRLTQSKTGVEVELPLLEEVGWAIIDYIKNARPKSESHCVFIKHTPPFEHFSENYNFSYMIGKYFHKAEVTIPHGKQHGLHSLRHSLASNMLAVGTPMPIVSEALGHVSTKSTSVYLKIDIPQLKKCALDTDFGGEV
jgi:integrase/recombinase XerD